MQFDKQQTEELMKWLRESHDFVVGQGPALAEEILRFGWYGNVLTLILGVLGVIISSLVLRFCYPRMSDDNPTHIFGTVFSIVGIVFAVITIFATTYELIMLYFAPRLYILNYLT